MKKSRKGFTLVELLLVVAILGSLSASMMIAGGQSTKKAQVAKIAVGIGTIGNAVQLYIAASGDAVATDTYFKAHSTDFASVPSIDCYKVTNTSGVWHVSYDAKRAPITGDAVAQKMLIQISKDNGYEGTRGLKVYF